MEIVMSSILWFVLGVGFGFYFPEIVSKIRATILSWAEGKKNGE
jgi:hypothetical protein